MMIEYSQARRVILSSPECDLYRAKMQAICSVTFGIVIHLDKFAMPSRLSARDVVNLAFLSHS